MRNLMFDSLKIKEWNVHNGGVCVFLTSYTKKKKKLGRTCKVGCLLDEGYLRRIECMPLRGAMLHQNDITNPGWAIECMPIYNKCHLAQQWVFLINRFHRTHWYKNKKRLHQAGGHKLTPQERTNEEKKKLKLNKNRPGNKKIII